MNGRSVSLGSEPWALEVDGRALVLPPPDGGDRFSARLCSLEATTVDELRKHDLEVVEPEIVPGAALALDQAIDLIRMAAGLDLVIRRCVQEVVLLRAPGDSFDVSHSEPRWPTRIFVSIPAFSMARNLRVAEAIVHEAMHLNLTLLEGRVQLVDQVKLLYSPWRGEARPASGVLHGLYVFACIHRFFEHLVHGAHLGEDQQQHVDQRIIEIREEVLTIDRHMLLGCLTSNGIALAQALFNTIEI